MSGGRSGGRRGPWASLFGIGVALGASALIGMSAPAEAEAVNPYKPQIAWRINSVKCEHHRERNWVRAVVTGRMVTINSPIKGRMRWAWTKRMGVKARLEYGENLRAGGWGRTVSSPVYRAPNRVEIHRLDFRVRTGWASEVLDLKVRVKGSWYRQGVRALHKEKTLRFSTAGCPYVGRASAPRPGGSGGTPLPAAPSPPSANN
jgi:hypothetical protein